MGLCQVPAMGLESERNQSSSVLLSFVQGRRSLHPSDEDQSLGTPGWSRQLECYGFEIHLLWFRYRGRCANY